jgi:putative membrane protein insertion efficiency factor
MNELPSVGDDFKPSPTPNDPFSSRKPRSSLAAQALMLGITGYQKYLSPLKGAPTCRFVPSCSSYALEAVRVHGAAKGTVLATLRVLKCQPLHPGGFDPVPAVGKWKNSPRAS